MDSFDPNQVDVRSVHFKGNSNMATQLRPNDISFDCHGTLINRSALRLIEREPA